MALPPAFKAKPSGVVSAGLQATVIEWASIIASMDLRTNQVSHVGMFFSNMDPI